MERMPLTQLNERILAIGRELEYEHFTSKDKRLLLEDELTVLIQKRDKYCETLNIDRNRKELDNGNFT